MPRFLTLPFILAGLCSTAIMTTIPAYAYAIGIADGGDQAGTVSNVSIRGNQRIETQTIQSYLGISTGKHYSASETSEALKRLFATGFFSDANLHFEGETLVVEVVENPIINKVVFEGNDEIKDEDLDKEVSMRSRSVYTRTQVQNDVKRILDIYRASGRYSASVTPKVVPLDQNRVNLVYEIAEGSVTRIEKVSFIGNKNFSDKALREVIRSEEHRWYKFFSNDDKFDADRLLYDQELLRRYYVANGYADFQVKSAITELTPNKEGFYVTFTLEEGNVYNFGKIDIDNKLKGVNTNTLLPLLQVKEGEQFDASKIEITIDKITEALGNQGFAFIDIAPDMHRDAKNQIMGITFRISEGPRVYIERVNITGNVRTLDKVVRREFRVAEGDAYNTTKLKRSEQRINNLGFFENVKLEEKQGSTPDKVVVNANVQERSTGELSFGVGYSSVDGALTDVGIREKNLLGRGQDLRARFMLATQRQQIDLGFTEPYFLGRDIAAGFDIFRIQQDLRQESSFDRDTTGFTLRANYALTERLRHSVNYTLSENTISNVQDYASRYVKDQAGTNLTSSVGQALTYDARNNRFDPTEGWYMRLSQDYAGLGGDSNYLRHEARGEYYYALAPKWTVQFVGLGGNVTGVGEDVRIQDRFFIGGREIRGFNNAGLGPRDMTTSSRDALGGENYYAGTVELRFPLGLPDEMGFTGALFNDVGNLWGISDTGSGVVDSNTLRASAGVGLAWTSPFGPIRIDFAKAYIKEDEDEDEIIRFDFGTRF